jgi:hypothetical protein
MLTRTAVATGLVAVLGIAGAGQQKPVPDVVINKLKSEFPKLTEAFAALGKAPTPSSDAGPLPTASLTEPFEIGEALYDPSRVADAVVSLLTLMQIAVVPDTTAGEKPTSGKGITLSESEVHALINLATQDLEAGDMDRLPYGFAQLHAGVAELLPGVSVEQLAEAYNRAYEARPEDLIAKAMMGRPIEPDMKITRAQIWFLLMDGFAGAAATNGRWGTADKQVPDLKSPNAQWSPEEFREVLARLPLVTASRLVTITAPDVITQGATAGPPVNVTARVNTSAPPLVSRVTGRTLIAARAAGSLSGQDVTWRVHEESMLHELGKIVTPVDDPTRIGADGVARLAFQPGVDPTKGAGQPIDDWETVEARFDTRGLVANAYTVPATLAGLTIGASRVRANVHLRWRSSDLMFIAVFNSYDAVNFEIPGLGGGTRDGIDTVIAMLHRRADGSYVGQGTGQVTATQTLRGGTQCQKASVTASQRLRVKAEKQTGFGPTHILDDFVWSDLNLKRLGTMSNPRPDGGYYRLMFYPMTSPGPFGRQCISIIPAELERRGWGYDWFIPFNDAQWTRPGQGYGIALKARGVTMYFDMSSVDPLGLPLPGVKALFQLTGSSYWFVIVAHSRDEFPLLIK